MEIIDPILQVYAEEHTSGESQLLQKINRETHSQVLMPRMLSGHLQGRVLSMFSRMIGPQNILEIGTYTGYSALCLAEGLAPDGKIITLDINDELEERVRNYLAQSELGNQIDFRIGNASEIIPGLKEKFDLVFIDADKMNYSNYFDLCLPKVVQGGFLIADNVLWSGKVVSEKEREKDKDTRALVEFNQKIQSDDRVENVLFPVRDGLMVIRKK